MPVGFLFAGLGCVVVVGMLLGLCYLHFVLFLWIFIMGVMGCYISYFVGIIVRWIFIYMEFILY